MNAKTNINEIKRAIALIYQPGDVVELRAFDKKGFSHPGYYDNFTKLAEDAAGLSNREDMASVYVLPNVIKKVLLARTKNHLYPDGLKDKKLTADEDVLKRRWFIIDIDADCDGVSGISSTDAEHQVTIDTAHNIINFLISIGFPKDSMILTSSGNGTHILVRIVDMPNTTENTELIKTCLLALSSKFTGIDLSVFNPSRVFKLTGTVCRKGDALDDRPHRTAEFLEVPENIVIAPIEAMEALKALAPKKETPSPKTTYKSNGNRTEFDLETWLSAHGIEVTKKEPYQGGTRYILKACPFDSNHSGTSAALFKMAGGAIVYKCQHNHCVDNDWGKLREMLEPECAEHKRQYEQRTEERGHLTQTDGPHILTDTTNAQLIVTLFGDIVRYDHRRERFLIWNSHRWQTDNNGKIFRLAIEAARARYQDAANIQDLKERERISNWAISSENRNRLEAAISLVKNFEPITDTGENWDTDPWLLGVQNGVVDLKTGQCRDGKQSDNITMTTGVKFDANAQCPLWLSTLSGIFQDDGGYLDFIHRYCGYSITGLIREQSSVIGWGEGANGKGIVAGALRNVMGDYAYDAPFSTFEMNYKASIPNDIAALEHKRIVTSSETNNGSRLNEARLKAISHGDPVTARYLHAEFFTFSPVCHIFLFVNHKPRIKDDSFGFWRGAELWPFLRRFEGAADDKDLSKKLEAEKSGILNWFIVGCLEWQKRGLSPLPDKVTTATLEYRRESNVLAEFYEDCCVVQENAIVKSSELYKVYCRWAEQSNLQKHEILSSVIFSKTVAEKFKKVTKNDGKIFVGIGLVTGLVTGFSFDEQKHNVFSSSSPTREKNIENPPQPVTPSLFTKNKAPKRLSTMGSCPDCGGDNIGLWPDGTEGYFCLDCFPDFNEEVELK